MLKTLLAAYINYFTIILSYRIDCGIGSLEFGNIASVSGFWHFTST